MNEILSVHVALDGTLRVGGGAIDHALLGASPWWSGDHGEALCRGAGTVVEGHRD